MRAWSAWFWLPVVLALFIGWTGTALAQLDVQLTLSERELSVGETLDVRLDAMSSDDQAPSAPELVVPSSFEVRGPSIGTRQQVSISGFQMVRQSGISATWQVTATRPGVYSIGPASVQVGGERREAQAVQIRVLPEGQRSQRAQRRARRAPRTPFGPFDPFDPFGSDTFDDLFDRLRGGGSSAAERLPPAPADLVPERLPDSLAFVDARLDTVRAVVGQQITLTIYAHGSRGLFQEAAGAREPSHPDFLAQRLVEDGSRQAVYQYERDGERWIAVKVREIALFPIRAGRLQIGPLEFGFLGRRYGVRSGEGLRRQTRALTVDVYEPPALGRPAGFAGDVGDFQLSASVEPRHVAAGGSVAVTARVMGTGRLPGALRTPEQAGVEWLEPTLHDDVSVTRSRLGGTRKFSYVVRLTRAGILDLGSLTLPLYDPKAGSYRVAEAPLGEVRVEAPAHAADTADGNPPPSTGPKLSELVKFRTQLAGASAARYWSDRAAYWWLLGAGPALVLLAAALRGLERRLRRSLEKREHSRATLAQRAIAEARQALARAELRSVVSAAERALYHAIEWATGLRARALLRAELGERLRRAGLSEPLANGAVELLDTCAELRRGFPAAERASGPSDTAGAQVLVSRAEALVKRLVRLPPAQVAERAEPAEEVRA